MSGRFKILEEEDLFLCDKCKNPGVESMFQYKDLNICTECANKMRQDKNYKTDVTKMVIEDINNKK